MLQTFEFQKNFAAHLLTPHGTQVGKTLFFYNLDIDFLYCFADVGYLSLISQWIAEKKFRKIAMRHTCSTK